MMAKEFLGIGWSFPVAVDSSGKIAMSKYEEDIREAILIILGTSKGERVMRADFGCGIHDMVFQTINTSTLSLVELTVREALTMYEPRIEIVSIKVTPASSSGVQDDASVGKLLISVVYTVRATNNQFNLVYPFYLNEGT
jgi:phage baseplate assembly protein W